MAQRYESVPIRDSLSMTRPGLSSAGGPAGTPTGKRRDTKPKRKPRPKRKHKR